MTMLDLPAFVVTTQATGQPAGCLLSFATQTRVAPPRFLVGLAKRSHTLGVASLSQHLAVHVLSRRHRALAELFGGQTGHQINKFDRCSWRAGPQGMPMLYDAIAWFVGLIIYQFDVGDHVAYVLEPVATLRRSPPTTIRFTSPTSTTSTIRRFRRQPDPAFFRASNPRRLGRRYGLRFTIDGLRPCRRCCAGSRRPAGTAGTPRRRAFRRHRRSC